MDGLDNGWGIWSLGGDKVFFNGLVQCTLKQDWPWLMTADYITLWDRGNGILPDLASLTLWRQAVQQWQAEQTDPKNPTPFQYQKEFLWGMWADKLPPWLFTEIQGRFIHLMERVLAEQGEPA